jgi:hypothetical protein
VNQTLRVPFLVVGVVRVEVDGVGVVGESAEVEEESRVGAEGEAVIWWGRGGS